MSLVLAIICPNLALKRQYAVQSRDRYSVTSLRYVKPWLRKYYARLGLHWARLKRATVVLPPCKRQFQLYRQEQLRRKFSALCLIVRSSTADGQLCLW